MKKSLVLSALTICCFTLLQAQPVLNSNIIPGPGTKWIGLFLEFDPAQYPVGMAGADQTWNFTGIIDSLEGTPEEIIEELKADPFLAFEVIEPNGLIGADSFPDADFAIRTLIDFFFFTDNYSFVEERADGLYDLGTTSITEIEILGLLIEDTSTVVNQMPSLEFKLPLSFNEHFIRMDEEIEDDVDFDTRTVRNTRDSIVYDAYGSLETPFGSFDQAVRFTHYSTENTLTTSLSTGTVLSNTSTSTTSYEWYSPDQLAPLVDYDPPGVGEEAGILTFYIQTDAVLSNNEVKREFSPLTVAPNPASEQVQVSFSLESSEERTQAYLFDMKGRLLATENWQGLASGTQQQTFSLPNQITPGTYVLLVRGSDFSGYQKVVVR
ncbi:MAG: T9SS type A sorting domain-containing protein [Saprospiraceae bacterium]|nr:T9SS type A sorting domain-containing protein [Saprospiraceae bacterium]